MRISKHNEECQKAYDDYKRRYEIKEHIPDAVWDFPIIRPEKPSNPKKITNWGKPKKERKFPYYSKDFIKLMEEKGKDEKYKVEYDKFVAEEWRRRREGFFFYNGDILEYVTGRHYCTLQYWLIPATKIIGGIPRKGRHQPDFRDKQRDVFYCLDYARKDPKSAGLTYIDGRRQGKTSIVLGDGYWDTTENYESVFAIQSKTEKDAIKMFKKLIDSWKFVPIWFKPQDTEETTQKKQIYFGEKKRSGVKLEDREYQDVLNSLIYAENSKEEALDGEYASYVVQDEAGKGQRGLDIRERWNITRECLFDGNMIVGFGVVTSTIEDMDKYGSETFQQLWNQSDTNKRLPNGLTHSYLYQLFLPAYYGYVGETKGKKFVDEWGYTDTEASKKYHRSIYNSLEGEQLMSYQRKYPITINDAWVTSDGNNNFSTARLIQQKIWNDSTANQDIVRGNFMWRNGIQWGEVDFYPDVNGRWLVAWQPQDYDINRWDTNGMQKRPTREFCVTGIDPFSHEKVVDVSKGSNGAAVTILKSYPTSKIKEGIVCIYDYRQSDPNKQVEDMIMQCVYYSSPALIESNVSVAINGFKDKGYYGYLEYNPLEKDLRKKGRGLKGFPTTSKENIESLISMSASYILDNIGKKKDGEYGFCPFNDLIQQWLDFNPEKRTPFDLVIAAGLAIILARVSKPEVVRQFTPDQWLPHISKSALATIIPRQEEIF